MRRRTVVIAGITALGLLAGVGGLIAAQRPAGVTPARTAATVQRPLELLDIEVHTVQKRTLKDSAYWYRDVIASNGATIE